MYLLLPKPCSHTSELPKGRTSPQTGVPLGGRELDHLLWKEGPPGGSTLTEHTFQLLVTQTLLFSNQQINSLSFGSRFTCECSFQNHSLCSNPFDRIMYLMCRGCTQTSHTLLSSRQCLPSKKQAEGRGTIARRKHLSRNFFHLLVFKTCPTSHARIPT